MKKLDPKIIRVGDVVKIVNPLIFIRCGYPLSKNDMKKEIYEHYGKIIEDLLYSVSRGNVFIQRDVNGLYPDQQQSNIFPVTNQKLDYLNNEIVDLLAVRRLFAKKFGGTDRTIHTELRSELKDKTASVTNKKNVKTGIRVPGSSYRSSFYDPEVECDPPYLSQAKTHKILQIDLGDELLKDWKGSGWQYKEEIWIETANVEKIPEENDCNY
jgi:hypothetical protein